MEKRQKMFVVLGIIILLSILIFFIEGRALLRIIIGLILCLFLPGFLLMKVLVEDMDNVERMIYSFGLSLCILAFIGFILDDFWKISFFSLMISLLSISFLLLIINKIKNKSTKKASK